MWTAVHVRAHFMNLPENTLITRRELLHYGTQDAVDSTIRDLLQSRIILRMAWGVYIRPSTREQLPTADQVAFVRIAAFQRKRVRSTKDEAYSHDLIEHGEPDLTFEVNASSSQFRIFESSDRGNCLVYLKNKVARKMALDLTPARKAIKAIWHVGEDGSTPQIIERATRAFSRADRREFRTTHDLMPGWLSDNIHKIFGSDQSPYARN